MTGECGRVRARLLEVVERTAPAPVEADVRAHVEGCAACAAEYGALAEAWSSLPELRPVRPAAEVRDRVLARAREPLRPPRRRGPLRRAGRGAWWILGGSLAAAVAVGLLVGVGVREGGPPGKARTTAGRQGPPAPIVAAGEPAPLYAAPDVVTGETVSLADHRGRVVLLNVWATWCGPCEAELPSLERLHREMGPRGLDVVAVSIDQESSHLVRDWIEERGITFTVLHDRQGDIEREFDTRGVPESFVIDRDGVVVARVAGPRQWGAPEAQALVAGHLTPGF